MKRYFLISYISVEKEMGSVNHGDITIKTDGEFPTKNFIASNYKKGQRKAGKDITAFIVSNIFEFKNEEDYKSWSA